MDKGVAAVAIDCNKTVQPLDRTAQECIASCHAYLTLREDYREHFRRVNRDIGFRSIRFHAILHDWVGVYNENAEGTARYNFQNLDKIYDFFVAEGVRPFVELSFMPEQLASGTETCFKYKGNTTPPKEYDKWADLISAFVSHLIDRYGIEEVLCWNFEVWNEPNLEYFWRGGIDAYFRLYETTVRAIKAINKDLRVGGPATAGNEWVQEILEYCKTDSVPIDFISTHHYCADAHLVMGKPTRKQRYRGTSAMADDIRRITHHVRTSHLPDLPIYYTEWNVSPCHEDVIGKDSEFTAVFVLDVLRKIRGMLDGYALWTFTDIFEESGPGLFPFSGKYGLVNMHGIAKPVFHAYYFLASLYDCEIPVDHESVIVTRDFRNNIRLLCWNIAEPTETDFAGGEWAFPDTTRTEKLRLQNIAGRYRVRLYRVDRTNGNAFRTWQEMGKPQYLDELQIEELHEAAQPSLERDEVHTIDGECYLEHTLEPNAIVFYEIEKV